MALHRENVIRAAEKYVAKGKLEAAIKEYRKVLAENPNDANTLNRVGDLYARIERFDEAVKLFSQIAEQYTRDGFFVKAIAIYKKIIKLDPTSLAVYERLAELYHKQGLLNEARTQYQVLADYYEKHDNAASAITIYQRMAEFEPDNPSFHLKLAELYESQRLTEKAMKEYRLLADLLIVAGSVEEAVQVYLKALEVSSSDLDFVRDAVSGLHDTGHVGGAAKVLARAVELNPEAAGLARQVGLEGDDEEEVAEEPLDRLEPTQSASFEMPDAGDAFDTGDTFATDDSFSADDTFSTDDAFEIPETSFDGIQEALEESGISTMAQPEVEEDGGFTFDLDDDEPPASLVTPPADMLESSPGSSSFDSPSFDSPVDDSPAPEPSPSFGSDGTDDFDIDLDFDITPGEDLGVATAADPGVDSATTGTEEFEIDWPADDALELPDVPAPAAAVEEPAYDLDETLPSTRASQALETFELEAFELGEPSLEPVEHVAASAEPAASDPGAELEIDLDSLDLEPPSFDAVAPDSGDGSWDDAATEPAEQGIRGDAAEVQAQFDQRREEDLLAEAKVFFKYGLQEKARDRLGELFQVRPDHLEGLDLQTRIDLDAEQFSEAMASANLVSRIAGEADTGGESAQAIWTSLQEVLSKAGFTLEGDRVVGEPGQKVAQDDRIAQLLDDLSLEAYDAPVVAAQSDEIPIPGRAAEVAVDEEETVSVEPEPPIAEPEPAAESEPAFELEPAFEPEPVIEAEPAFEPESAVEPEPSVAPPSAAAEAAAAAPPPTASGDGGRKLISLVDELGLDDLEDQLDDELAAAPEGAEAAPVPVVAPLADPLEDTGMSWLDDLESESQVTASDEEKIFEEEDDFFDLAAELERELSEDSAAADAAQPQEQSLEDIIEGFKQGVAENLSPEDYDTHFNLGIAYREMGLLDEAIGEFQLAAKDDRYIVDSSSLLGICFLEKGLPELAVRSYRKGLASPSISEEATLGLLYDMGTAYLSLGDSDAAYKTFVEVYGMNSHYRDVSTRLQELKAQG